MGPPDADEIEALSAVLTSGRFGTEDEAYAFEQDLGAAFGSGAVTTSSGSTAIELLLRASRIGPGDEVIVPAYACRSVGDAVRAAGARPCFADVSPGSWTIDPEQVRAATGARTRAIVAVDQYGCQVDIDSLARVAGEASLLLIHDVAASIGLDAGPPQPGAARVASFHPSKVLRAGEGGAVLSADEEILERIRFLRSPGALAVRGDATRRRQHADAGFSMRMSDLDAALARVRLRRLGETIVGLRSRAEAIGRALEPVVPPGTELPSSTRHAFHSYALAVADGATRDRLLAAAAGRGLRATPGHPGWQDRCPVATSVAGRMVVIPNDDSTSAADYGVAFAAALSRP